MPIDIVGEALDLVGEDDGVGAAPAPQQQQRSGPQVRKRSTSNEPRRLPLGFQSLAVPAGATVVCAVVIQNQAYRLEELVIPSNIAPNFTVEDAKVGNTPQFAASGSLPAVMFSELCARKLDMKWTTCNSGLSIYLSVKNTSTAVADFRAGAVGTALD